MSETKTRRRGPVYKCVRCGSTESYKQLMGRTELKCYHCGYHVLRKVRPPIVKRLKAL